MSEYRGAHIIYLWGVSEQFPTPQFVGAFPGSLAEVCDPAYTERRDEAIEWFLGYGDPEDREGWLFYTTESWVPRPEGSPTVDQIVDITTISQADGLADGPRCPDCQFGPELPDGEECPFCREEQERQQRDDEIYEAGRQQGREEADQEADRA